MRRGMKLERDLSEERKSRRQRGQLHRCGDIVRVCDELWDVIERGCDIWLRWSCTAKVESTQRHITWSTPLVTSIAAVRESLLFCTVVLKDLLRIANEGECGLT